ncbi:IS200/IS605 family accessory protein TnpB-related protein, partial [Mitsuokella jalaludinii]|uniref:IS200/IS605 family accessory protein TnpB-related protein n=1 Tax=Mitsuokella jalaludinii TaxID=187979 RepID=UPI003AF90D79
EANLGRKLNQSFVQLPFARFIQMLQYKAGSIGMKVVLTEESYTSGTSLLDDEAPVKACYDKSRRVHRGLFLANASMPMSMVPTRSCEKYSRM